jgi:hypothetical protein
MISQTREREQEIREAVEVYQKLGRHVAALGQADHAAFRSAAHRPRQVERDGLGGTRRQHERPERQQLLFRLVHDPLELAHPAP